MSEGAKCGSYEHPPLPRGDDILEVTVFNVDGRGVEQCEVCVYVLILGFVQAVFLNMEVEQRPGCGSKRTVTFDSEKGDSHHP